MAAIQYPPLDAGATPRTNFISTPWTDPSGKQWLFEVLGDTGRWNPVPEGASDFGDLDGEPADNDALAAALALKAPKASPTFSGPAAFTGQIESSGSTSTASNSNVLNMGANDARYKAVVAEFNLTVVTAGLGITGGNGTWTYVLPTGAKSLDIVCVGSGGGGGSGCRATAGARGGGGGGGAGCVTVLTLPVAALTIQTLTVSVPAGGNGGASRSGGDGYGFQGSAGGISSVTATQMIARAAGGGGGQGGFTSSVPNGGTVTVPGGTYQGAAGGGSSITGTPAAPEITAAGPGGGGGGGSVTAADAWFEGIAGGPYGYMYGTSVGVGIAGSGEGGIAGNATSRGVPVGAGGAGGAGAITKNAGTGSNGVRGSGGGGGGGAGSTFSSGAGGSGGDGFVRIIVSF